MLPPKWIYQPEPFRLAQTHQSNGYRDGHKHLNRIYEKQIFSYFHYEHLIALQLFSFSVNVNFLGMKTTFYA